MSDSPEEVVQRQLEAYNAHDIETFMACYSQLIQIMDFPTGKLITEGHLVMKADYATFFKEDKPHVELVSRIIKGNVVIDHEKGSDLKRESWDAVAIYNVVDGLIEHVWFLRG